MERFWRLVDKSGGPDACWEWQGARGRFDYGTFSGFVGLKVQAHRFAYELETGVVGKGRVVRHTCDNPPCCNPAHLLIGSYADNNRDKVERGRSLKGVDVRTAKLDEDKVREIRRRFIDGESQGQLAREFGVYQPTISKIVRGETWRHVTD